MKSIFICFFTCIVFFTFYSNKVLGQLRYVPIPHYFPNKDSIINDLKESEAIAISDAPEEFNKEFIDYYKGRSNLILSQLEDGIYLYDKELYQYVANIIDHIRSGNPVLKKSKIRFFITCYPWPNASSVGNGTILINVGLFQKLSNEGQLAFVLCHELAHDYLSHSDKSLYKQFKYTNSEEFKNNLKEVSEAKYGAYSKAKSILRNYLYDERKHSREYEYSADSMALELLGNTSYSLESAISCMSLLDTIDRYKYNGKINYKKYFGFQDYPFKERWLEVEGSMFGGNITQETFFNVDSVKTHPDCSKRLEVLSKQIISNDGKNFYLQGKKVLNAIINRSDFEVIEGWEYLQDYGRSLFFNLKHIASNPQDSIMLIKTGTLLRAIHEAQSNHTLGKYVQRPSVVYEKEYNELLEFIDNLRLVELSNIGYYFHKVRLESFSKDERFFLNYLYFCKQMGNVEELESNKDRFKQLFPNGKLLDEINNY